MATQRRRSVWVVALCFSLFLTTLLVWGYQNTKATSGAPPIIDREKTILKGGKKELQIIGENFESGVFVQVETANGVMAKGQINVVGPNSIKIVGVNKDDFPDGVATITLRNPSGLEVKETLAVIPSAIGPSPLTQDDIRQILSQGVSAALKLGVAGRFAILDREGNILALYEMTGAPKVAYVRDLGKEGTPSQPQGLEGLGGAFLPEAGKLVAMSAAISKAGTGAFLSTQGNAFTTRTAAYIIREHIPPFIKNMPGGPLFGVQVSSLGCSDIKQPGLPLGMSGDTGGIPIYKNGIMAGGFGVEINGQYNVALNRPRDFATKITPQSDIYVREGIEEMVAFSAVKGYDAPDFLTADKILVNGIRLAYKANFDLPQFQTIPFNQLPGKLLTIPETGNAEIRTGVQSEFRDIMLRDRKVRVINRFFPFKNSKVSALTSADVEQVLFQAVREANRVRAAIRRPIEVPEEVNMNVTDFDGTILGIVSTPDAPVFGFDVCVEKSRSAVFFSRPDTIPNLRAAGMGKYADILLSQGLRMDGQFMFTARSVGWIARPFYPDGIEDMQDQGPGPLASSPDVFSPLNNGFQTDYLLQGSPNPLKPPFAVIARSISNILTGRRGGADQNFCDASNGKTGNLLNNTLMIFTGSSLLFKNGKMVGAVGISGDGIDQDDITGSYGSENFEAPPERRVDRLYFRGIRIPYTKFPRHPHIGEESD